MLLKPPLVSLETIEAEFNQHVAECVGILTDEPGGDRASRKSKTYAKMAKVTGDTQMALVVKTADRLANVQACVNDSNQRLLDIYRAEHPIFKKSVYRPDLCDALWKKWML